MPAQSSDPVAAALQHSINKTKLKLVDSLDTKLVSNANKVLTTEIKYVKFTSYANPTFGDLKSKYILLTPSPSNSAAPSASSANTTASTSKLAVNLHNSNGKDVKESTLPEPKRVLYPADAVQLGWKGSVPVGAGFVNFGNTCYLNSTLQAVFHVPAFVNWLSSDSAHFTKCESLNGMTHIECLICAMADTLQNSHRSTGGSIKPLNIYSKAICKHLVHGHQEDAHEFLCYLIEGMERSYLTIFNGVKLDNYSKETTPLNQIFGGYMRTEVVCLECHHVSTTFQHFQDMILDIRQASTVEEALEGFFSRERLGDAYKCEQCKKRVAATKKFSIERVPKVLCVQLKRFSATGEKNNKHITLKQWLDITKYRHTPQLGQSFRYKLVSLITHFGSSSNCGHYTAVGQGSAGNYYLFDDSIVRPISVANVLNSNAYILMYELDSHTPTKEPTAQTSKLVVLENSNLSNGLGGFTPQPNKSVNGLSSNNSNKQDKQFSRTSFEKQSPMKIGITTTKTASPSSSRATSPAKAPIVKTNCQSSPPSKIVLTAATSSPNKKLLTIKSPAQNSLSPQPSTSRLKSQQSSRGTESLVPYLSVSSDSDSAGEINSPPRFIGPVRPNTENGTTGSSKNCSPLKNHQNEKVITNGWYKELETSSAPTKNSSLSQEKSSLTIPLNVDIDKAMDMAQCRSDMHSPAGSTSSGRWSVTSADKEKNHDRSQEKMRERNGRYKSLQSSSNNGGDSSSYVVSDLLKFSHNGYGLSSVTTWNGDKTAMEKEVIAERIANKRPLSYDDELDMGKVKKYKKHKVYDNNRINKFQQHQNKKNKYPRPKFYHHYTNEKSKRHRNNNYNHRWY